MMKITQRLALVGGVLLTVAAHASDPFQQLYEATRGQAAKADAGQQATRHQPRELRIIPSPVQSVIYGQRLPDGRAVTYCHIEHAPAFTATDSGDPQLPPREQR